MQTRFPGRRQGAQVALFRPSGGGILFGQPVVSKCYCRRPYLYYSSYGGRRDPFDITSWHRSCSEERWECALPAVHKKLLWEDVVVLIKTLSPLTMAMAPR